MIAPKRMALPLFAGFRTVLIWLLLLLASFGVANGLSSIIEGSKVEYLLLIATLALLIGWITSRIRVSSWIGIPILALIGAGFLLVSLTSSTSRLVGLFVTGIQIIWDTLWEPLTGATNLRQIFPDLIKVASDITALILGFEQWAGNILKGIPSYDKQVLDLVWGMGIWVVFAWCAWAIRRGFQTLGALLPMVILLAGALGYVKREPTGLALLLGSTLALAPVLEQIHREQAWKAKGTDFSEEIRRDLTFTALPLLALLILAAVFAPSFSIRKIADRVRQFLESPYNQGAAFTESLGLHEQKEDPLFSAMTSPGLPRQHLIGAKPDLGDRVVMVIRTHELPPMPSQMIVQQVPVHYWRGLVYDQYTGHGWTSTAGQTHRYAANEPAISPPPPKRSILNQEVNLIEDTGGILYAAGDLISVDKPYQVDWRSEGDSFGASTLEATYQATSSFSSRNQDNLKDAGSQYPGWIKERYLALPVDLPAEVRLLARSLTAGSSTPYDQALAIQTYLRSYPYTLDVPIPPPNQDIVEYFLFELKKGYCDYYSTAMVVLARAAGIPARMATGYASGSYDSINAAYVVSEADAHSWPEIYFPDYGWVEFEPTAGRSLPGEGVTARNDELGAYPFPRPNSRSVRILPGLIIAIGNQQIPVYWVIIAVILILIMLRIVIAHWRRKRLSPLSTLCQIYADLRQQSRLFSFKSVPGQTPLEFGEAFGHHLESRPWGKIPPSRPNAFWDELQSLIRLYTYALYSPHQVPPPTVKMAQKTWAQLRWRLWQIWLWGVISPRRVYNRRNDFVGKGK
jgi:transglutaminase-like putative cysteine protease